MAIRTQQARSYLYKTIWQLTFIHIYWLFFRTDYLTDQPVGQRKIAFKNTFCQLFQVQQSALSNKKVQQATGIAFPCMTRKCELLILRHRNSGWTVHLQKQTSTRNDWPIQTRPHRLFHTKSNPWTWFSTHTVPRGRFTTVKYYSPRGPKLVRISSSKKQAKAMAPRLPWCILQLSLLLSISSAQAQVNITLGSSLTPQGPNTSWLSPSGDFAFGFRQLEGNSLYRKN
jgi:hypothetical protein